MALGKNRTSKGKIKKGEIRNPKGRPKGPMPKTLFRNAVMSLITEQDHIKALQTLRDAIGSDDIIIRLEAVKIWFSYFPLNEKIVPNLKNIRTQQEVLEYSEYYLDLMLKEFSFDPEKLMNILEKHSGFIRAAQIEKIIMDDPAMSC